MSCSTYTYRDYAMEYSNTEDMRSWQPVYLDPILSTSIFGFANGVASLTEREMRNPLTDDDSTSSSSLDSPRTPSFPQLTMEVMEECLMEPLVFMNNEYMTPSMVDEFMPTVNAITKGDDSVVLVSACTYGVKNIIFNVSGCVLCVDGNKISLYVPSTLLRKTRDDLIDQSFTCKINNFNDSNVFHKVTLPESLVPKCMDVYERSRLRPSTRSHTPLMKDGFNKYCNVSLVISICLSPSRTTDSSSFDGTLIVQHGKRLIDVTVLDIVC